MRARYLLISACLIGSLGLACASASPPDDPGDIVKRMNLKPGHWRTTLRITAAEISPIDPAKAVPAEAQAELRKKVGTPVDTDDCIATGRAPNEDLILPGLKIGASCTLSSVDAHANKLTLTASCGDAGFNVEMSMQADYRDTVMTATIETATRAPGAGVTSKMTIATSSKYIGQCPR